MNALEMIAAERARQIDVEGWTPEHDDRHDRGELAMAAACYATLDHYRTNLPGRPPVQWPWDAEWWKPTPATRMVELVKAAALIVAEIERLQRVDEADRQSFLS